MLPWPKQGRPLGPPEVWDLLSCHSSCKYEPFSFSSHSMVLLRGVQKSIKRFAAASIGHSMVLLEGCCSLPFLPGFKNVFRQRPRASQGTACILVWRSRLPFVCQASKLPKPSRQRPQATQATAFCFEATLQPLGSVHGPALCQASKLHRHSTCSEASCQEPFTDLGT